MNDTHIKRLPEVQNKDVAAYQSGTPKGLVELDGQMLPMHLRIRQKEITPNRKDNGKTKGKRR